jgi:uncharacterized protein YacL (UPF0231 family)
MSLMTKRRELLKASRDTIIYMNEEELSIVANGLNMALEKMLIRAEKNSQEVE